MTRRRGVSYGGACSDEKKWQWPWGRIPLPRPLGEAAVAAQSHSSLQAEPSVKNPLLLAALLLAVSACASGGPAALPGAQAPSAQVAAPGAARINYPRIFGVRPGSPFLFRVPVSGALPLTVSAQGLPDGLVLDPQTGVVSGTIRSREKQTYAVVFTTQNAAGNCRQSIRFVVGDRICLTPPMGWNSWYVWSESVNEKHFRAAADSFVSHGLAGHGWSYIALDDCWQGVRGGPAKAILPNEKFPDMQGAVDHLHGLGLKAGIYTVPALGSYAGFIGSSCDNAEGSYAGLAPQERLQPGQVFGRYPGRGQFNRRGAHWFFDADIRQMAEWGFDMVKVDWHPNDLPTTQRISAAVRAQKRDIALSLSNEASFELAADYAKLAEFWRTTGDINDSWETVASHGLRQIPWAPFAGPGHWNDPDMLQVGRTNTPNQQVADSRPSRLAPDEQQAQMSLWCLNASPLILSCDLDRLDAFTLSLLTNDEVIAVNQDPLGRPARELPAVGNLKLFLKEMEDGSQVVGILNAGPQAANAVLPWDRVGLAKPATLRDLWAHETRVSGAAGITVALPGHGCLLLRTVE